MWSFANRHSVLIPISKMFDVFIGWSESVCMTKQQATACMQQATACIAAQTGDDVGNLCIINTKILLSEWFIKYLSIPNCISVPFQRINLHLKLSTIRENDERLKNYFQDNYCTAMARHCILHCCNADALHIALLQWRGIAYCTVAMPTRCILHCCNGDALHIALLQWRRVAYCTVAMAMRCILQHEKNIIFWGILPLQHQTISPINWLNIGLTFYHLPGYKFSTLEFFKKLKII